MNRESGKRIWTKGKGRAYRKRVENGSLGAGGSMHPTADWTFAFPRLPDFQSEELAERRGKRKRKEKKGKRKKLW